MLISMNNYSVPSTVRSLGNQIYVTFTNGNEVGKGLSAKIIFGIRSHSY